MLSLAQRKKEVKLLDELQENIEETNTPAVEIPSTADIQFDDSFDVKDIQSKLELDDESFSEVEKKLDELPAVVKPAPAAKTNQDKPAPDKNTKKYVIYIDSENIEYMENLSTDDRKKVINGILSEQISQDIAKREAARIKKLIFHIILGCLTFIVVFPLLFTLVNNATSVSIKNYNVAKENVSKLYRDNGKIKMQK